MANYVTKRLFKPKRGIDLKSAENIRGDDYLTNAQNVIYDGNGNLCKRNGFQLRVYGADAFSGLVKFNTTDYNGSEKTELIILGNTSGNSPQKIVKNTFSITNTLVGPSVTVQVFYDEVTLQYRMVITGGVSADIPIGLGKSISDLDMTGLSAVLPGVLTGTISGAATTPAAFLDVKIVTIQSGATESFDFFSTEELVWGGYASEPTTTIKLPRENPSYSIVNGSLYWYKNHTSNDKKLYKYDGHTWYEVGLNRGQDVSRGVRVASGTSVTDVKGTHTLYYTDSYNQNECNKYVYRLAYKDKTGVFHTGEMGIVDSTTTSVVYADGGNPVYVLNPFTDTPNAISGVNSGTNARSARVNGLMDDVTTITVHSGHTLKAGDVAYFWRKIGSGGFFIERLIEEVTPTSIKISTDKITELDQTDTVDLYDNAIISNNFRIEYFYSTQNDDESVFAADMISSVPFNSLRANGVQFNDMYVNTKENTKDAYRYADGSYLFPSAFQYPPPNGKFITSGSNGSSLLIAGDPSASNTVYSSTVEDCEAFYIGRNSFTVEGTVTALGSSGSVAIVGTENKTYAVTGDIPGLNFRVEKITDNLGIQSHASVSEIDEGVIVFNTHRGMFSLAGGRQLSPVGEWPLDKRVSIIEPYFTYKYSVTDYAPAFSSSYAAVIKEKKIIINATPSYYGTVFGDNVNLSWVYDYSMGGWFVWTGVDMSLGAAFWEGRMWVASHSGVSGKVDVYSMTETNSNYDYSDHGSAIEAVVQYHWESAGDSNLYKKFQWLTIYTPPGNGLPYNLNVKTWANYEIQKVTCFTNPVTQHTEFSKYATPPGYTIEAKLRTGKMCSMLLEISNDTANEGLWIGGTEVDIATDYRTPSRSGRSDS